MSAEARTAAIAVVDVGHSRIKWGTVGEGSLDLASIGHASTDAHGPLCDALERLGCTRAVLSGQSRPEAVEAISRRLRHAGVRVDIITTGDRALPVAPAYPALGCDRWLALQKPRQESDRPCAVVDCGTAITVDLVDGTGRHRGGWIMAGLAAARSGLFARAPGLERDLPPPGEDGQPATETALALSRGGLMLAAGGIDRAVRSAEQFLDTGVELWITGGDAPRIATSLAKEARHDEHLVLHGLAMATRVECKT